MSTHEVTQALGVKFSSVQTSLRRQNRRDLAVRWINLRAREEGKDERLEVDEAA
jgi:ribosomal protein S7